MEIEHEEDQFSGYPTAAKVALFGIFTLTCIRRIFFTAQAYNLEDSIALNYPSMFWGYILLTVIIGAFLAWVTDNYTQRHYLVELNCYVQLASIAFIPIYMTKVIPKIIRHFFFYAAWFNSSFYLASSGIIHSVFFDQVNMSQLPDHQGYMRRYILYYYMCRTAGVFVVHFLYSSYIAVGYDIKHYLVSFLCFALLLAFQLVFFSSFIKIYTTPLREDMLSDCLYSLVKYNVKLTKLNRMGYVERSAIKLIQVCWPLLWVMVGIFSSDLAGQALVGEMVALGEKLSYIAYVNLVSMIIFFPLNEMVIVPFLMKHSFLKSAVHLFGVGFLWLSISLLIGGIFMLKLETATTTQPSQRTFGQLRFFSLLDQNIVLSIDEVSIKIYPHGAGSFLRIPVDINHGRTVHVQVDGRLPYKESVEVQEMKSLSHYVGYNGIKRLRRPDPLNKLVKLDDQQSYYYSLENENKFSIKFISSDERHNMQRHYPNSDEIMESIVPGVYNFTVLHNNGSVIDVDQHEFLRANIYCLHSFQKSDSNIGIKFILVTNIQRESHTLIILLSIASSYGRTFLMMSFYYFIQTESPTFLRGTTFTFGEVIYRVAHLLMNYKLVRIRVTAVGLFSMSLAMFGLTFITWKYVTYFYFSSYRYK